jgi:hypothetical protein
MKPVNHVRNATRLVIVFFWLFVVGVVYSVIMNSGNAWALSWITWLFYAAVSVAVLYTAIVFTFRLWKL